MLEETSKTKRYLKQALIFCGLFLGVLFIGFYVVNLDLGSDKSKSLEASAYDENINSNEEIKKRLGSTVLSMESYDDWARFNGLIASNNGLDADADQDNLPNYLEYVYGTNPLEMDTDGDKYSDKQELINGYDPDAALGDPRLAVFLTIPKLGVSAPMVWSESENEKDMLDGLENGVGHFLKTASPGQNGNAIIYGHSSNYLWAKGDYNHIFKDLNNLEVGDVVELKAIQKNGRVVVYRYQMNDKFVTSPDDARIFEETENPTLTLSTCWPIGTNLKRLIVKFDLVN